MPSEKKAWEMPEHVLHFGEKQEKLIVVCPGHLISRNISEVVVDITVQMFTEWIGEILTFWQRPYCTHVTQLFALGRVHVE